MTTAARGDPFEYIPNINNLLIWVIDLGFFSQHDTSISILTLFMFVTDVYLNFKIYSPNKKQQLENSYIYNIHSTFIVVRFWFKVTWAVKLYFAIVWFLVQISVLFSHGLN